MRTPNNPIWAYTMQIAAYSVMVTAMAVVMAECGHMLYALSFIWQ
jgi:hypothetical protein